MFGNISKCKNCKSQLVEGPNVKRSARTDSMICEVRNIPTQVCPNGCQGSYWYWLDFGVEVFEMLSPLSQNIAKRKLGIFKTRHLCRSCEVDLENTQKGSTFVFRQELMKKGTEIELEITAPALCCPQCKSPFLPAQTSTGDAYYNELSEIISIALTDDLIYE